jgi:hypothetical protein
MAAPAPEQRLAEALRLQASTGVVRQARGGTPRGGPARHPGCAWPPRSRSPSSSGVLLGTTLALVSLLLPGVLPGTA